MNWEAVLAICSIIGIVQVILVAWVARRQSVSDQRSLEQKVRVESLEHSVVKKAEELIAAKFELASIRFDNEVKLVAQRMDTAARQFQDLIGSMKERLDKGDNQFEEQGERLNKNQVWAMATFGTRAELTALVEQVQQVRVSLSAVQAELQGIKSAHHGH